MRLLCFKQGEITVLEIIKKLENKAFTVGVIGIGEKGLPVAANCANAGFVTLGFDSRPIRAEMINGMNNYIEGYSVKNYRELWYGEILHGTTDFGAAASSDIVIICADDHIAKSYFGDITPESCIGAVSDYLRKDSAVVYLSESETALSLSEAEALIAKGTGYTANRDFICAVGVSDCRGRVTLTENNYPALYEKLFKLADGECV